MIEGKLHWRFTARNASLKDDSFMVEYNRFSISVIHRE